MRIALISVGITMAALIGSTGPSHAAGYDNNWCIIDGLHGAGSMDCSYATFQQCEASRRGNGGTCFQNPDRRADRSGRRRSQGRGY